MSERMLTIAEKRQMKAVIKALTYGMELCEDDEKSLIKRFIVDAEDRDWNEVTREFSQEVADRYNSLTAEEKSALTELAEWEDFSLFKSTIVDAKNTSAPDAYTALLTSAYEKLGGDEGVLNFYDLNSIATENFSEESIKQFAVKQMNTRDYAEKAKAEGYDGVIFKNIHDIL